MSIAQAEQDIQMGTRYFLHGFSKKKTAFFVKKKILANEYYALKGGVRASKNVTKQLQLKSDRFISETAWIHSGSIQK